MTEPYELQPAWFIAATRDEHVEHCGDCPVVDMLTELLALRPALAAAEVARDERASVATSWRNQYEGMKAEVERLGRLLAAAEAERDQALARANRLECLLEVVTLKHQDALAQATPLAALEAAARDYVAWLADMEAGRQGIMTGRRLLGTLTAAVAVLDGAPAPPP